MQGSGHIKVYPASYAGSVLSTRESIRDIFNQVEEFLNGIVELDFSGVVQISRAAAHELILQERTIRIKGGVLRVYNMTDSVNRMLQTVRQSLKKNSAKKSTINETDVAIATGVVGGALIGLALYNFLRKS